MNDKRKILSFDLDNTLFDDNTLMIPQSAIDAIDSVRDRYLIVLATGRDLTADSSRQFLETIRPDAYVHNNGTQVHIAGKRVFYHLFNKDVLNRLIDFSAHHNIAISALIHNLQYTTSKEKLLPILKVLAAGKEVSAFGDINDLVNLEVQTLGLAGSIEDAALIRDNFPELKVTPVFEDSWYDIMEKSISKLVGMKLVVEHFGLGFDDVIAFGDSMNDYELLCAAGTGVAMGNACQKLKDSADYVTTAIDNDGIKNAIEKLCK